MTMPVHTLVFDPALSPHYEVILIHLVPEEPSPSDGWDDEEEEEELPLEIDVPFYLDWLFSLPSGAAIADGGGVEVQQPVESSPPMYEDHEADYDPCRLME
uniref:Uncharacterized protein n=1 Tax=Arundo donax TaxID=35708 RepID=A0A0A8ZAH2_ARUDO